MSFACIVGVGFALLVSAHVSTCAVTEAEKAEIVNKHNELRRGVDPPASNMLEMSWNNEAAANAQKWANKCSLKHSVDTDREIKTSGCGENLYMSNSKNSWTSAIQYWYNEVDNFKYGVGSFNTKAVGHYTQVVWYKSYQVGCAMAHCPNAEYHYFYVCQYCPPGNYNKARPYASGKTCGDCPEACSDKLCTNPCTSLDKYSNCKQLTTSYGCRGVVKDWCPASCNCGTKIQ